MNCNSDDGDQSDFGNAPEELAETAKDVSLNLLPEKPKLKYKRKYELFYSYHKSLYSYHHIAIITVIIPYYVINIWQTYEKCNVQPVRKLTLLNLKETQTFVANLCANIHLECSEVAF